MTPSGDPPGTPAQASEPQTIHVLVVDDDQGDFLMIQAIIGSIERPDRDFEVEWVSTYEEALDAFGERRHDVYLIDYFLEDRDGLDLVREARSRGLREPLIMLTGRGSHDIDVEAMRAGASDYLVKGKVDPDLVERSIRYALERQRAEAALRDSEERHRGMFDHLPIGLYRVSPDGAFMDANPALVRILGHPDPEMLRERYASNLYVHPDDRARFEDLLDREGVVRGFESTLEVEGGNRVRVRNSARSHRSPDGEVQYIEGAVEDVTEERSARQLRDRAESFDTLFEHSGLAILLLGLDGSVRRANPALCRALGYEEGELGGRSIDDLVMRGAGGSVRSDLEDLLAADEGSPIVGERRFVGADGAILWARVTAALVEDASGDPDHVMLLLEDVAETGQAVQSA